MNELRATEWRYADCELFQIGLDELRQKRAIAPLTPRQAKIAILLGHGFSLTDAAKELGVKPQAVKVDASRAYKRLGLDDPKTDPYVKLGIYGSCELFQIGLQELGLLVA